MNDLHQLHNQSRNAMARLHQKLPAMRCRSGHISQAQQITAGGDALRAHSAQGIAEQVGHIGSGQGVGVKL